MKELLDLHQVAKQLNVCEKTILRLIHRDNFPAMKIGKALRFNPVNVERWCQRREVNREWRI